MDAATRVTLEKVTLGFAVTLSVLAVSAAVVTAVAFFILSAPQIMIIGGVIATAVLTGGAITLFVNSYLLQKKVVPTAPPIPTGSVQQIPTDPLPPLRPSDRSSPTAPRITVTPSQDSPSPIISSPATVVAVATSRLIRSPLRTFTSTISLAAAPLALIAPSSATRRAAPLSPYMRLNTTFRLAQTFKLSREFCRPQGTRQRSRNLPQILDAEKVKKTDPASLLQAIVPNLFQQTTYDELAIVPFHTVRPLSEVLIEELKESTLPKGPTVEDLDLESSIVLAAPQIRAVPAHILTLAIATGTAAHTAGVGAAGAQTAIAAYLMSKLVNPTSWVVTKYLAAPLAQAGASTIMSTPILGVSLAALANAVAAAGVVIVVTYAGIVIYNRFNSEENRIDHNGAISRVASYYFANKRQIEAPTT